MTKKTNHIYTGNALVILGELKPNSIDAIITDPPYGISFCGRAWDRNVPDTALWKQALRVLKPGGHLLAFASPRTYHRLASNIELAGFEIRDQIMWLYSSGFPRSHNIALAISKKYGAHKAKNWRGWGTTLKPAHEPIVIARKPFSGAVVDNVLQFGTGGLNIDACRIGDDIITSKTKQQDGKVVTLKKVKGRFPANAVHNDLKEHWSPFFYCAKPSKAERDKGLEAFELKSAHDRTGAKKGTVTKFRGAGGKAKNIHPTVKPIALMEYLITLVTPDGGTVLDPFTGSGSTLLAAKNLGYPYIGIEQDTSYVEIAQARLAA